MFGTNNHLDKQKVPTQDGDSGTPLHRAVTVKDINTIKTLLKYNPDINQKNYVGWAPLHVAVNVEMPDVVALLISHSANVNVQDESGETPLFRAVIKGNVDIVDILLKKGANYKLEDTFGRTPFHLAVQQKRLNVIEIFFKNNVDANILNSYGQIPLFYVSQKPYHLKPDIYDEKTYIEIIDAFIKRGTNINFQNSEGCTVLHDAMINNNFECIQALLKLNADVNIQDNFGSNVLHLACKFIRFKYIKMLINYNIDINAVDTEKKTALHYIINATDDVERMMEKDPTILFLLKHEANVNLKDKFGRTALHAASEERGITMDIIKLISDSTNDLHAKDDYGRTAFHYAAINHNVNTLEYLLEKNADVNAKDSEGRTPLHASISFNNKCTFVEWEKIPVKHKADINAKDWKEKISHITVPSTNDYFQCVKVLLDHKADINAVDNDLTSPLHLACFSKNAEVVKYFIKNGADSSMRDKHGRTVFHYACMNRLNGIPWKNFDTKELIEDTLNVLVEENISVNCVDRFGKTPLHYVAENNRLSHINELLLNIGADINIVDLDHNSAFENFIKLKDLSMTRGYDLSLTLFKKHVIKMKVLKLWVRERIFDKIYKVDDEEDLEWIQSYEHDCNKEIDSMKSTNLDQSNITCYDFLKKSPHNAMNYTRNQNVVNAIQSDELIIIFPIYGHFLKNHLREVQRRSYLYKKVRESLELYIFEQLPTVRVNEILQYLDNSGRNLNVLFELMKPAAL